MLDSTTQLDVLAGFNSGSASSPVYNGARLANDQDVVVVSMK